MCHIKSNSDSLCPTVIGDGIGATFGGRMGAASVVVVGATAGAALGGVAGAALGGVACIVFGPCAIATAAAGAVAGVAAGGIGGAILGLYRGRKRRCHRLVMEEKIHTRWYIVSHDESYTIIQIRVTLMLFCMRTWCNGFQNNKKYMK